MSKTERAKQLVAIATDETRALVERIASLEQADALRKEMKVGWNKVGWTYDPVTPAGYLEDLNLWLTEEKAKLEHYRGHSIVMVRGAWNVMDGGEVVHEGVESLELAKEHVDHFHDFDGRVPTSTFEESRQGEELPHEEEFHLPEVVQEASPSAAERGEIGVMARDLLQTPMPYEDVALAIRARYPYAKTTARSLASVAADMRRDGIPCPSRRKGGK